MPEDTRDSSGEAPAQVPPEPTPDTRRAAARHSLARRAPPALEQRAWQSTVVRVSTVIAVWLGY